MSAIAKRENTTLQVVPSVSAQLMSAADEWNDARREFIRKTYCGGAPDDIASTFLMLCERRRLSPEARHVYLINRAASGKPANWVIQTGIDGYRLIADRTQRYAGSNEPAYIHDPEGRLAVATVTVHKAVGGLIGAFTASARWDEYSSNSPMWTKMPHTLLAKCAEALALRKAFPEELSGIYTDVELDQAEQPAPRASVRSSEKTRAVTGGAKAVTAGKPFGFTEFWAQMKARGIDAGAYEALVGQAAKTYPNAQAALDALTAAEYGIDPEGDDAIDAEYVDQDGVIEG